MADPEELARQDIDKLLGSCDWTVQDKNSVNLSASRGVAVLKTACEGKLVPTEAELARERQKAKVAEASRLCSSEGTRRRDASATISDAQENAGAENQSRDRSSTQENQGYETGAQLLERVLAERRQKWNGKGKYKAPVEPDEAKLPMLPEGWVLASLEGLADVIDPNPSHRMPKYVPNSIPLISSENFVGTEEIDFSIGKQVGRETLEQQRSRYTVEDGDFVLSRIGTIGKTRFISTDREYCLSHALVVLKVQSRTISKRWLRKTLESETVLLQAHTGVQSVGVPDLGMGKIREFAIPVPPFAEQQRVVAEVERRLSVVEELEAVANANLQRATRLRQSILQRAFAGRLVLPNKDHYSSPQEFAVAADPSVKYGQ